MNKHLSLEYTTRSMADQPRKAIPVPVSVPVSTYDVAVMLKWWFKLPIRDRDLARDHEVYERVMAQWRDVVQGTDVSDLEVAD